MCKINSQRYGTRERRLPCRTSHLTRNKNIKIKHVDEFKDGEKENKDDSEGGHEEHDEKR